MIDGTIVIATKTAQTDSNGSYSVSFGSSEWEPGCTIEVTAQYHSVQETRDTAADASSAQQVDIAYPYEIVQFGSLTVFLASAGLVGIVGAVLVKRGRKQDYAFQEEFDTTLRIHSTAFMKVSVL